MEPVHEEKTRTLEPSAEQKPKRFRIVKLEERIAPGSGGNNNRGTNQCVMTQPCLTHGVCNTRLCSW
jgi:hypothetical protein